MQRYGMIFLFRQQPVGTGRDFQQAPSHFRMQIDRELINRSGRRKPVLCPVAADDGDA